MTQNRTLVMKFGGAAVETLDHFAQVAAIVNERKKEFTTIAVVVSAMRGTTDRLISFAHTVNPNPPQREYDMLISVGERISCSLLAMALAEKGSVAVSFTGSQAGIITSEEHTDAKIIDVKPHRLQPFIDKGNALIVAGFQGVSRTGAITTLGRGGSDTTAVALAIALGADQVEFYKDVAGLYSADPKREPTARHIPYLSYTEATALIHQTGNVLHPRCVRLAEKNNLSLHVTSFHTWDNPHALRSVIGGKGIRPSSPIYECSGQPQTSECCR